MPKVTSQSLAEQAYTLLQAGTSVEDVKLATGGDASTWSRVSPLVYNKFKLAAQQERDLDAKRPHVATTSNADITDLLALNRVLAGYALLAPPATTMADFRQLKQLANALPGSEAAILAYLGGIIMTPRMCAILKQGIEGFAIFTKFTPLVEAAIIAYYQENYVSAFLTLVPVIEGMLLRWSGFDGTGPDPKPQFEDIRKFVGNSYLRQPNPGNILFHEVYVLASQAILAEHLYRNSAGGQSYANFSRHLAAHLLRDEVFAMQDNCIRLFILLDALLKVYTYETKPAKDPMFYVEQEVFSQDVRRYQLLLLQQQLFKQQGEPTS